MTAPARKRTVEWGQLALLGLLSLLLLGFARQHHPVLVAISFGALVIYHFLGDRWFARRPLQGLPGVLLIAGYLVLCSFVTWVTTQPTEESLFWLVFLLPVVVAGSRLSLFATTVVAALASGLYFLLLPEGLILADRFAEELPEFLIISAVFFFVGLLVQPLAEERRRQLELQQSANQTLQRSLEQLAVAEEGLRRSEQLAVLGEMAAGVAHEIRNPLGIISASAQLLGRKLVTGDPESADLAGAILEESTRLNALISEFLAFGRETRLNRRVCDVAAVLRSSVEGFQSVAVQHGVTLHLTAETELTAAIDSDLVQQALLNLFLNAVDAMPDGGEIKVVLHTAAGLFRIEVSDTGRGIPEDIRAKIFNPFFTTRDQGTGLGLANAHKFIEAHGGRLYLLNSSGQGTTFVLELPKGTEDATHSDRR